MIKLSEKELDIVVTILKKYVPNFEIFIFGSRYNGNTHEHSDLDIAIKGREKIDLLRFAELRDDFQNSDLPFRVDLIDFNRISPEFQSIILNNSIILNLQKV